MADDSPLVRVAAVWAFKRLAPAALVVAIVAKYAPGETDEDVKAEWAS